MENGQKRQQPRLSQYGDADCRLGRAIATRAAANPDKTGIYAIPASRDAFAARAILAAAADQTLDVQYYIWRADETGFLLFEALWEAAKRGVRVRLLLDDNNTAGLDPTIVALDAHPNIEVRLYNPLFKRSTRFLNYLTDFTRLNRRMHNKSFTADGQATIIGGRNVGNEYFAKGGGVGFRDLDVIAVGAVVRDVSAAFERYWQSPSAWPAATLLSAPGPDIATALTARFEDVRVNPSSTAYLDSLRETTIVRELLEGGLHLEWTTAQLFCDDPAKTLDTSDSTDVLLLPVLLDATGSAQRSFDLVSPYLVPARDGTAVLTSLSHRGVKVRILTNSLAATDVVAVHAGYAKRRRDLLRAGVRLYELKPSVLEDAAEGKRRHGGSSFVSLHAKTFALDGTSLFVGSFNFDQRSAHLNTEMGLLIESPALAEGLTKAFDDAVPEAAYEVRLASDRRNLEWIELSKSRISRYTSEPETGFLRRSSVGLLSTMPIEWLL
jgi:putative cardiolipin synthase